MGEVRLAICIQHHQSRGELLAGLLAALTPAHVFVARDPEPDAKPSPLRTYLAALNLAPEWCTHYLILQDDTETCAGFVAAARLALAARPELPLSFWAPRNPPEMGHRIRCAAERGETFTVLPCRRWAPVVALCWPRWLVGEFLSFVEEQAWPHHFRADDEAVGHFLRANHLDVLATVPSLVEHPDVAPSVIGRRQRGGRVAARYIGVEEDALAIPWQ